MNLSMMADTDKFKQFVDELQKAVEQGDLPRDMLDFARRFGWEEDAPTEER